MIDIYCICQVKFWFQTASYQYLRKESKLNRMRYCERERSGSVNLGQVAIQQCLWHSFYIQKYRYCRHNVTLQRVMGVVAVIGGGIRGLVSAYVVAKGGLDVVVYEKEEQLGGHAITVNFDAIDLDLRIFFLNPVSFHLFSFFSFRILWLFFFKLTQRK